MFTSMGKEVLKDGLHFADFTAPGDAALAAQLFNKDQSDATPMLVHRLPPEGTECGILGGSPPIGEYPS